VHELQVLFHLIQSAQQQKEIADEMDNSILAQMKQRLLKIGPEYGLDLSQIDLAVSMDGAPLQPMQTDLMSMFKFLQEETQPDASFSPDVFVSNVMDLIAEYTESFNNDEIRAIFQEASLEYHLEGQLITPRYLGLKVGLIRKRRDERQTIHLSGARRR
jgi:hypothetical protein